ncbi:hypothetical protein N007_14650 [Alicyclobacillus acidoterrestris ATCC 49025]|nr:hypothetical protein N007_14650 [Alicyclobacillus acidoterrestris ATCC 49025]
MTCTVMALSPDVKDGRRLVDMIFDMHLIDR